MNGDVPHTADRCPERGPDFDPVVDWRLNHIENEIKELKESVKILSDYSHQMKGGITTILWFGGAGAFGVILIAIKYLLS